jgi:hypothetical protein
MTTTRAEEIKRVARAVAYDTPLRQSFYPLVEWGWTREMCLDYLRQKLGVVWKKSACVYCPFNALQADAIERHKNHPDQVAEALLLEHVSLSLNPRGRLYRDRSLIAITSASGNHDALRLYEGSLGELEWAVYRVRRIYQAGKDKLGKVSIEKKGSALRSVERLTEPMPRERACSALRGFATGADEVIEEEGIAYLYRERCADTFPTREEFLVALPAVVVSKARYGLDWFEERWNVPQLSLFDEAQSVLTDSRV